MTERTRLKPFNHLIFLASFIILTAQAFFYLKNTEKGALLLAKTADLTVLSVVFIFASGLTILYLMMIKLYLKKIKFDEAGVFKKILLLHYPLFILALKFFLPQSSQHSGALIINLICLFIILVISSWLLKKYWNKHLQQLMQAIFLINLLLLLLFNIPCSLTGSLGFFQIYLFVTALYSGIITLSSQKSQLQANLSFQKKNHVRLLEKWNLLSLIPLLLLAGFVLFFQLGEPDFQGDEFFHIDAARGYLESGTFQRWDWINNDLLKNTALGTGTPYPIKYDRAWPFTYLVMLCGQFLGFSEFSLRLLSVLSGLLFIIFAYLISFFLFKDRILSLLLLPVLFFSIFYLSQFRIVRMYGLFIFLSLLVFYLFYQAFTDHVSRQDVKIGIRLSINYCYLVLALILTGFIFYSIHYNILSFLPGFFLYLLYLKFFQQEQKYNWLIYLSPLFVIGALFFISDEISYFIGWGEQIRLIYYYFMFNYPFGIYISTLLLILGVYLVKNIRDQALKNRIILIYLTILINLLFFIFFTTRYAEQKYISHLLIWIIMINLLVFLQLLRLYPVKLRGAVLAVFFIALIFQFYQSKQRLYAQYLHKEVYSDAYQAIIDEYRPGDLLLGMNMKTYYLEKLPDHVTTLNIPRYKSLELGFRYSLADFTSQISAYQRIWLTWESRKARNIEPSILNFVEENFNKLHGEGIDQTGVEVYFLDKGGF